MSRVVFQNHRLQISRPSRESPDFTFTAYNLESDSMADSAHMHSFGELFATEFQDLQKTAQMRSYDSGDVIFSEGDPGDGFYIVEHGEVEISGQIGSEERKVLARVTDGAVFGEMAVLDDGPRSATAIAKSTLQVHFLSREELFIVLPQKPELTFRLLRELTRRIRASNQEILQAERLAIIGRFARTIVHDFKNPLNVIGLAAEMSCGDWADDESRKSSLERINRQISRMTNMLNELLEFTRGTSHTLILRSTDYARYITDLIQELRADVEVRKIKLELENEPPTINLQLEPQRFSHLVFNLVNNAADEMPGGGTIYFRFEESAGAVTTHVRDTGKGIAPEIAAKLFEPFATHGKSHGTGLGLSICKKIVEDHGGRIWAETAPEGGAIFSFSISKPRE